MDNRRIRYRDGSRPGDPSGVLSVTYAKNGNEVVKYRRWSKIRPEAMVISELARFINRK